MLDIATTASASVHTLTGSSRPGAVLPASITTPLAATQTAPRANASTSAHSDAEVIDLAGRTKALLTRRAALRERLERLKEQVNDAHPEPVASLPWSKTVYDRHAAETRPTEDRVGLVRLRRVSMRQAQREVRWLVKLATLEAHTLGGVAAKGEVLQTLHAVDETGWLDVETDGLVASQQRDVMRLAKAEADPRGRGAADPFTGYHAEITALQILIPTLDEASSEHDQAWARWREIDELALASRPTTLAGAIGALEYARREHHQFQVEPAEERDEEAEPTAQLVLHLLDGALGVLRPFADRRAPSQANLRPVQVPADLSAHHLGADGAGDMRESYRSWLYGELRMLNYELYGSPETCAVRQDNPGAAFHFPADLDWRDVPKPSTRAAAVLGLLGLLPVRGVDETAQPAASAA